jgi:hypothetical protein
MDECSHLWYDEKLFDANTIINDKHSALQSPTFRSLLKVAILNSRAHFEDEVNKRKHNTKKVTFCFVDLIEHCTL